jgi:triacylglycerol esterase/lipase EstA (alpha/beta hydrolase family)
MTESDWIIVTVADSGYRKPVRKSAVMSYGTMRSGTTFVDIMGRTIEVRESETEIARLVGSPFVGGV